MSCHTRGGDGRLFTIYRRHWRRLGIVALAGLALSLPPVLPAQAATLTVCASGCTVTTIAAAITTASPGDTIRVMDPVQAESGITVDKNLTIEGQGAASTAVDGGGGGTVFIVVGPAITVTIQHMTIRNGSAGNGGGIRNSRANLTINNSTLSGNSAAGNGGGIWMEGSTLTITNSTLSGNSAGGNGGGIFSQGGFFGFSTLTITNSTLSGNSAGGNGGGIQMEESTLTITNSTLSGNSATGNGGGFYDNGFVITRVKSTIIANSPSGGDCGPSSGTSPFTALGANLDTDGTCAALDADFSQVTSAQLNLGPLALNPPGATQTHAPLPGSVAINAASDCTDYGGTAVPTDQRGLARPQGAACDIGAYESAFFITASANPPAGGNVVCVPNPGTPGSQSVCTITTNAGYILQSVSGTCGGQLNQNTYTTNPITADCTVIANFIAAIPTLSEWAQIGMVALLLGGGLLAIRKRSTLG